MFMALRNLSFRPFRIFGSFLCIDCYKKHIACSTRILRRNLSQKTKLNAIVHSSTRSIGQSLPHLPRRPLEEPKTSIRDQLRQWQILGNHSPLLNPLDPGIDNGEETNGMSRPESSMYIDHDSLNENSHALGSGLEDLDRIVDYSEGVSLEHVFLHQGDLVSLKSSTGQSMLCTFLGLSATGSYQWYTAYGSFWFIEKYQVNFHTSSFFTSAELQPILQYLPQDVAFTDSRSLRELSATVPRSVSAHLLNRMAAFQRESDALYRIHASTLGVTHRYLAEMYKPRIMTFDEAVTELTGISSHEGKPILPALRYAVVNALLNSTGISLDSINYSETNLLRIEAKSDAILSRDALTVTRNYLDERARRAAGLEEYSTLSAQREEQLVGLKRFLQKCRQVIKFSRTLRQSTPEGAVVRNRQHSTSEDNQAKSTDSPIEFTASDMRWIKVVAAYALTDQARSALNSDLANVCKVILRATKQYPGQVLDKSIAHAFLVEIGVLDPYTVPYAIDQQVRPRLPELDLEMEMFRRNIDKEESGASLAGFKDSMSHFRKDWGNLPVYCIDSADTVEIDDGISIVPVEGSEGELWLHVHVCHLSAFTGRHDVVGRCAENNSTTIYMMNQREPMLPPWVAESFSIGPNKPVLTFSARISADGEISETLIQPGLVHNTIRITPSDLSKILDDNDSQDSFWSLSVGKKFNSQEVEQNEESININSEEAILLKRFHQIALKWRDKRPKLPFIPFDKRFKINVRYSRLPSQATTTNLPTRTDFGTQDPDIDIAIFDKTDSEIIGDLHQGKSSGESLVEECMLFANCLAADYAAARDIPVVFYGTRPVAADSQKLTLSLRERIKELGTGWDESVRHQVLQKYASTLVTSSPVESKITGFSQYTKVTSPLRRFFDLASLWQIDSALREEHLRSSSLSGSHDTSYLPLSRLDIARIIQIGRYKEMKARWFMRFERKHLMAMALARAHYSKEGVLPFPLLGVIGRGAGDEKECYLTQLHLACRVNIALGTDSNRPASGELWEVEIHSIDPYSRRVTVKPIQQAKSLA